MRGSAWFSRWLRTNAQPTRATGSANATCPPAPMCPNASSSGPCWREQPRDERRRFACVAERPARRDAHDRVATAHLLRAEAGDRRARDELLAGGQRGVDACEPAGRSRRVDGADLGREHRGRVHERREPGLPVLVGEQAPVRAGEHGLPGLGLGIERGPRAAAGPVARGLRRVHSITVATRARRSAGVPMRQSTPSGSATSVRKNVPRLAPVMRRTSSPTSQPNVTPW